MAGCSNLVRNLFFHVPMWFGMMIVHYVSVIYAIRFLDNQNRYDDYSAEYARTGVVFGILGFNYRRYLGKLPMGRSHGAVTQNKTAPPLPLLIYFAYFVLRGSVTDEYKRQE